MAAGIKIAVTALCAAVILAVLKKEGREFALPVVLVTGGSIIWFTFDAMAEVADTLTRFVHMTRMDLWAVEAVGKVVGLSLITKVAAEVCKGAGETGLASVVDTAGTILALACSLPLARAVVDMVMEMLG